MPSSSSVCPTARLGNDSSVEANGLTKVIRSEVSSAMTPSAMPATIASRCSASATMSAGSIPNVCRLIQRASSSEPTTPSSIAAPR